jgi:prepilin-type N-terminal cleavage/methylation domain-containing protein
MLAQAGLRARHQSRTKHLMSRPDYCRGFSLVELIVVMVIIGLLASMAIPRLSRGSEGAVDAAADADLRIVRQAIVLYAAEHSNTFPGPDADSVVAQLTQHSNRWGATSAKPTSAYVLGPYLVAIPPCPIGVNAGSDDILIDTKNSPPQVDTSGGEGWVYNPNTGELIANAEGGNEAKGAEVLGGGQAQIGGGS